MQTQSKTCLQCGKPVSAGFVGESCPQCLMGLGIDGGAPTTSKNETCNSHVPPVEQLVSAFPNLELQHLIGHGGMGAVYQAVQVNLDRTVALKILSPALSADPAFAERFLREARTLAKLSHPNIVTVFDFGKAEGFYYLTMEFIDGVNLRDTISANLLRAVEALAIVPQICDALQYAHDKGVVHRDIKPENILIAKDGGVKIADFGLAKLLDPTPAQFTLTGTRQIMGTRNYMAPEQIETPHAVDHRADLYSLGVVFYELLTGELPLGRFSLPSEKSTSVSASLDDVVMRTLDKDPAKRYQQASEIKTACESAERDAPDQQRNESYRQPHASNTANVDGTNSDTKEPLSPICQPFPVFLNDVYATFATGYGLLRGYDSHLELEYEIRDSFVDHKWSSNLFRLPIARIAWIKLHKGTFSTYIEIQADRFEAVGDLPNSKSGMFRIHLKKKERPSAEQLVHTVQQLIHDKQSSVSPRPPVKANDRHFGNAQKPWDNGLGATLLLYLLLGTTAIIVMALTYLMMSKSNTDGPQNLRGLGKGVPAIKQTNNDDVVESNADSATKAKATSEATKETDRDSSRIEAKSSDQ